MNTTTRVLTSDWCCCCGGLPIGSGPMETRFGKASQKTENESIREPQLAGALVYIGMYYFYNLDALVSIERYFINNLLGEARIECLVHYVCPQNLVTVYL